MTETRDIPDVIAPPPLIALAVVVLGLLFDLLMPADVLWLLLSLPVRIVIGVLLMGGDLALVARARFTFGAAGTEAKPWRPSIVLVTDGVFAWSRNPMYAGGILALAGLSIALASDWMLVLTIVAAGVLHFGVVKREEHYLERKFGDAYRRYRDSVPRYGGPF